MLLKTGYSKVMALFLVFQVCSEMSLSGNYYLLPGDSHHKIRAIQAYNNHSFSLDKVYSDNKIITRSLPGSHIFRDLILREMGSLQHSPSGAHWLSGVGVVSYQPWCWWVWYTCSSFKKKEKKTHSSSNVDAHFQVSSFYGCGFI